MNINSSAGFELGPTVDASVIRLLSHHKVFDNSHSVFSLYCNICVLTTVSTGWSAASISESQLQTINKERTVCAVYPAKSSKI